MKYMGTIHVLHVLSTPDVLGYLKDSDLDNLSDPINKFKTLDLDNFSDPINKFKTWKSR